MGDEGLLSQPSSPAPIDFVDLAERWYGHYSVNLLNYVWQGYDLLLKELLAGINDERSITQPLEARIHRVMTGDEPYHIQHGPYEWETRMPSPAQPPQYDLAFKLNAREWVMWPLEAKLLETDGAVADYKDNVINQFLKCRYAPFSSESAMLGYLLKGSAENVFRNLEEKIPCSLADHPDFKDRPCKMSDHVRQVEAGKPYPSRFRCYHLILEFPGVTRQKSQKSTSRKKSKK